MSLAAQQYKLKVKVSNDDDTRLWRYSAPTDYPGLCAFVSSTWTKDDFIVQYKDEEGDLITIASAQDLQDAFDFAIESSKKSLKLVVQDSVKSSKKEPNSAEEEQAENDECKDNDEEKPKKEFQTVGAMALDFLSDERITALVPELFAVLVSRMSEKDTPLTAEEITVMINTGLTEKDEFSLIVAHPLFVKYGPFVIPHIARKMAAQQNLYQHFRLETIKTWIGQLMAMLKGGIVQFSTTGKCIMKDLIVDIEFPDKTDTGKAIHFGVQCDLCNECPIIGDRYKCAVCADWDCCSKCEPKHDHPLLKLKQRMKNYVKCNADWSGMKEVLNSKQMNQKMQDIAASGADEQKNENQDQVDKKRDIQTDEQEVLCTCGCPLVLVVAKKAYRNCNTVFCDLCNANLFNEMVYHCPQNKNPTHHRNGFDVCLDCVASKMTEARKPEAQPEPEPEPEVQPEPEPEVAPAVEPEIIEMESDAEEAEEDKSMVDEFVFAKQLAQIQEIMNMRTEEQEDMIKALLIEHNGDIGRVVPLLLQ